MMYRIAAVAAAGLLVVALSACGSPRSQPADKPAVAPAGSDKPSGGLMGEPNHTIDVGDVEATLRFSAALDPSSQAPNVAAGEMKDMQGRVNLVTVAVTPPPPKQLNVTFTLASQANYSDRPVLVRAKVLRDNKPIGSFATVLGADAADKPFTHTADVLAGLDALPGTMLVHAQAELVFLPAGTNPATVDPAAVTGSPDATGAAMSNPVRINFAAEGGTP